MEIITNIVELIENEPRISHRVIAEHTQIQQKNVVELIGKYLHKIEFFGHLPFQTETVQNSVGAKNEQKTYYLNEPQATLLITYFRNNEIVTDLKFKLVKEFFRMRELLQNQKSQTVQPQTSQNLQLPEIRNSTKQIIELDKYFIATTNLIDNLEKLKATTLYRLDKYILENKNFSPLQTFKIDLESQFFLPTELGKMINKNPVEINLMIANKGFQIKENGVWKMTSSGRDFGIEINGQFSQIKWKIKTVL